MTIFEGFFENTLHEYEGKIAILHLDCDLYNSYKCCLNTLYDKVVSGGIILFDEYKSYTQLDNFPGAAKAIDEFFIKKNIKFHRFEYIQGEKSNPNSFKKKFFVIKP